MLKKVLCMVLAAMTILTSLAMTSAGAKQVETAEVGTSKLVTYLIGDVDLDGKVTIKDASKIQKNASGIINLSDRQLMSADVTDNTIIDVRDATTIQKYLAGVPCENCIGKIEECWVMTDENGNFLWKEEEFIGYPEPLDVDSIEKAVEEKFLELVNEERAKLGACELKENKDLKYAAKIRGVEITESFSHTRPNGESCFTAIPSDNCLMRMGENIAYNAGLAQFYEGMSEEKLQEEIDFIAAFMFGQFKGSKGHYENMINKEFDCTGVKFEAVISDGYTECYIVHMFGGTK